MALPDLQDFVASLGEKSFRGQQLYGWIYEKGVDSFAEMTNLSKEFREKLLQKAAISCLKLVKEKSSNKDNTTKFLFELDDGLLIESVLMFEDDRTTICISTQVGCAIDCKFCATGMMGLKRNLTSGEIIDQVLTVQKVSKKSITNIVCMGMGEPFHNYYNLINACEILSDEKAVNIAKKHIVVSTSGVVPKIIEFADEKRKYRLAISLNATTDEVRNKIMPLNRKWPITELLKAVKYYTGKLHQSVTFEYVLLKGINDSDADAERLKKLIGKIPCKLNLIPYNSTYGEYKRTPENHILKFYEKLADLDKPVMIRWSKGDDIDAGCGQLAAKN